MMTFVFWLALFSARKEPDTNCKVVCIKGYGNPWRCDVDAAAESDKCPCITSSWHPHLFIASHPFQLRDALKKDYFA